MGGTLRKLVAWHRRQPATLTPAERRVRLQSELANQDTEHYQLSADTKKVVVDVLLDGTLPGDTVRASLAGLGAEVFARHDVTGPGSVLSTRLPLDQAVAATKLPGVASITLVRRPRTRVGAVTTQGVSALQVDRIAAPALDGTGITVGVISDSYDEATKDFDGNPLTIHAAQDIASGDLPGPGNPDGYTQPVFVLQDADPKRIVATDEGRAMLQIVHDIAPGASLAFCTSGETPEVLATNIRDLRYNSAAHCNIIVDDIEFFEEPYFSDGVAALAVEDAVRNPAAFPGTPVLYYSAAGNNGDHGSYAARFNQVTDAVARAGLPKSNLQLQQVPPALTSDGFQNFDERPDHITISQKVTVSDTHAVLGLQWDSAWKQEAMTDYNLLVFDADGTYRGDLSGIDVNSRTGQAVEFVTLPLGPNKSQITYQLAISRVQAATSPALNLKYLVFSEGNFRAAKVDAVNTPTIFGHSAAVGADAVAAYNYMNLVEPTDFSSEGPVSIYYDRDGNRLAAVEVRQQPTISTVDGVDTTFFPMGAGADTDNDGFPNFSGTSAAAPHAAGVAALLLQAAGGPASLTDTQVRTLLESTALGHDTDPGLVTAAFTSSDGFYSASLTGNGNGSDNSAFSRTFFVLSYAGTPTSYLRKVVIDLAPSGEEFDPSSGLGFPFSVSKKDSSVSADAVSATLSGDDPAHPTRLSLVFAAGAFPPGGTLSFGLDRDATSDHAGGNSADLLAGSSVKFRYIDGAMKTHYETSFENATGNGYSPIVGYGLIDAAAAVQMLRTAGPPAP